MNIEVYAVCYNEEKLLPYFIRHYSQFAKIIVYDNFSTDRSIEIMQSNGVQVVEFNSNNEFREDILVDIRNNAWKDSKADWCIVVDIDELIYHKNIKEYLKTVQGTVILPRMFEMFAKTFPVTQGQIYEEVFMGTDMTSKMNMFRPSEIKAMNYDAGCHNARPEGNYQLNLTTELITMHFKHLSPEYTIWRNQLLYARQSDVNRAHGWNWHMAEPRRGYLQKIQGIRTTFN